MKLIFVRASLVVSGLALVLLLGEVAARVYVLKVHQIGVVDFRSLTPRHRLGWQGTQSIGNLASTRPRILVVGDSMTTPLFVRQGEMYYAVLGRLLNAEIFAYGGQGFGTLGASIRPDGSHWDARGHRVVGEALAQWLAPVVGQIRSGSPMVVSSSPDVRHQ